MAKKIAIFITLLCLSISLVLPSSALYDLTVPDASIELYSHGVGFVYKKTNASSFSSSAGYLDTTSTIALNLTASDAYFVYPLYCLTTDNASNVPFKDSDAHIFKGDYTYHVSLVFVPQVTQISTSTGKPIVNLSVSKGPYFTDSYLRNIGGSGFESAIVPIKDICTNVSYTFTTHDTNNYVLDIVFNCPADMAEKELDALTFKTLIANTSQIKVGTLQSNAYYDYNQTIYNNLVLGQLGDLQQSINDGNKVTQEKLDNVNNSLNTLDQSVIAGNDQAHKDSQDLQNKIQDIHDQEQTATENNGDASESIDNVTGQLNMDDFRSTMDTFFGAIGYMGSECSWTFPASGNVPFVGNLWSEQTIDFSYWWAQVPYVARVCVKFVFIFGFIGVIWHEISVFINLLLGKDAD